MEMMGPLGPLDTEQTFAQQGVQNFSIIYCESGVPLEKNEVKEKKELTPDEKLLLQEVDETNHILRPSQKALQQEAEARKHFICREAELNGTDREGPCSSTEQQTCSDNSAAHSRTAVHRALRLRASGCDSPPSNDGDLSRSDDDPFRPPFAGVRCGTVPPPTSGTGIALRSQFASILKVMDIHHNDRLQAARGAHAQVMDQMQSQRGKHAEMMNCVGRLEARLRNGAPPGLTIAAPNLEPGTSSRRTSQLVWDSIRKHADVDAKTDQSTLAQEEESQTVLRATDAEHEQGADSTAITKGEGGPTGAVSDSKAQKATAQGERLKRATKGPR